MKRRASLVLLAAGPHAVGAACAPAKPPDRRVRLLRERLRTEGRVEIEYEGDPVEVRETEAGPVARSLLCTHFGCRVQWESEARSYRCPCHEARFDEGGRPVVGPALLPLRPVRLEEAGADLLVGEP